jgi:hypothetical protein
MRTQYQQNTCCSMLHILHDFLTESLAAYSNIGYLGVVEDDIFLKDNLYKIISQFTNNLSNSKITGLKVINPHSKIYDICILMKITIISTILAFRTNLFETFIYNQEGQKRKRSLCNNYLFYQKKNSTPKAMILSMF